MKSYTVIYRTTYYPQNNASDIESFILQHIRDRIKITDLPKIIIEIFFYYLIVS